MKKFILLIGIMVLAACAGPSAQTMTKVGVAIECSAPVPSKPAFPADQLTGDEDIFTTVKILWADRLVRMAYELGLEPLAKCTEKIESPSHTENANRGGGG